MPYKNKRAEYLFYAGLFLVSIYYLIGIFPVTRFETDSVAIANACEEMIQSGKMEENVLGHSYHMQSGTYLLIISVTKVFNFNAFTSYSIITIVFAIIYWIFLFLLLRKITNSYPGIIILILFLFQEIFILSYYANSAVIASAFWIISFYILWVKEGRAALIISAMLLSAAMWFRVDIAFTFPSVLLLLYMKHKNIKQAIFQSILLAVSVVPLTLLLMYLVNADVYGFLGYTQYHGQLFGTEHNIGLLDLDVVKAHAAYISVLILFLIISGIIISLAKKNIIPVLFLFSGLLFYYLLGINNTIAPKHLSYYTLFFAMIILSGINYYGTFKPLVRKVLFAFILILFVGQYLFGIRVDINSIPYQYEQKSTLYPEPTIFSMGSIKLSRPPLQNIEMVVGSGTKISTADELSGSSGLLFSPIMWFRQKSGLYNSFNELTSILRESTEDTLFFIVADGSSQFVINNLFTNGFVWQEKQIDFNSDIQSMTFNKDNSQTVIVNRFSLTKNNIEELFKSISDYKRNSSYLIFIWDWQNYFIDKRELPLIQSVTYQIHKLI